MAERTFYSKEFTPQVNPPDDLLHFFLLLSRVIRYQVEYYPHHIFAGQSVDIHTRRMVTFWWWLDLPDGCNRKEGERMLWVHDIPEIRIDDLLAVEAALNPHLAKRKEEEDYVDPTNEYD